MSLQLGYNLGRIARTSLSCARLSNPNLYGASTLNNSTILSKKTNSLLQYEQVATIATSNKKSESTTASMSAGVGEKAKEEPKKKKYWIPWGFDDESEEEDLNSRNFIMFHTITIGLCGIMFLFMYMPDLRQRNWKLREAYIELARREALGLPFVDPNLIPPENMILPTEEELGDFEIII